MAAPPWRALLMSAMHSNAHLKHSSYFQLATATANGRPANRTVVFRGFQVGCDKIQIHTDSRTGKIEEIAYCPYGEICWYFTDTWEQFRINGRIDVIDSSTQNLDKQQQREQSWFAASLESRLQYLRPCPRLPVFNEEPSKEYQLDPSKGPLDTFCLLVLNPEQGVFMNVAGGLTIPKRDPNQVDYVNLKSNERLLFNSSFGSNESVVWKLEKVNP